MNDEELQAQFIAVRLERIIATLKPYEKVEIKLVDNQPGKISVVVTSNYREVFTLTDSSDKIK